MTDADIRMSPGTASSSSSGGGFLPSAGTPLPQDILEKGRDRVRIAALVFACTWVFVIFMNEVVVRIVGPVPDQAKIWNGVKFGLSLVGLVVSLGMAWIVGRMTTRPERALDLGLAFEVFTALIVSLIIEPRTDPQAVSWICVTILIYPAIAPSSPRKTFLAAILSATTVPVALLYARLLDPTYSPPLFILLWLILPGYVCAILAVIPAKVIRGLGSQVRKARELGSYQLEDQIGKGGMGEVYRAKHRLLARPAAVKLISPAALSSVSPDENRVVIERFRREAEAAATLRSPHTIELYDYGIAEDGTFYYVMELLDGIDFHELITRHGPIPAERVVYLIRQACDSLGEAHLAGLVHRDVKPSNILACRMGLMVDYVKVLDFGLVKHDQKYAEQQVHITSVGMVSGTPAFMAPESISGMGTVGPPADVYALGCVAYWLLTGQNVFKAPNATMMMMQHVQASPVPPSLKSPQPVPRDLEELLMRCLAKDPANRPDDAAELARQLDKCRLPLQWSEPRARQWWQTHTDGAADFASRAGSIVIQ